MDKATLLAFLTKRIRDLQAIAAACKRASLNGWQRVKAHWANIGIAASVIGLVATIGFWFYPRNTINDELAESSKAQSQAIEHQAAAGAAQSRTTEYQAKIISTQLEQIKAQGLLVTRLMQQVDLLAAGVADVAGSLPLKSREVRKSAEKLNELLTTFRKEHSGESLSPQADLALCQAQATIDLANGRFAKALDEMSAAKFEQLAQRARVATKEAIAAGVVRALSFEGLGQWDNAIETYSRLAVFDRDVIIPVRVAICLHLSGRSKKAVQTLNDSLTEFESRAQPSEISKRVAAAAYKARGVILDSLGRSAEASNDATRAVDLINEIDKESSSFAASLIDLAIYTYDSDRKKSDTAFARAEAVLVGRGPQDDEVAMEWARLRNHRARKLAEQGRTADAAELAKSVVGIRRAARDNRWDIDSEQWLADSLNNLGAIYIGGGDREASIAPLTEAIGILSDLVDRCGQHGAIPSYIRALTNRADALSQLGRANDACADAFCAAGIARTYASLIGDVGSRDAQLLFGRSLRSLGCALVRAGARTAALEKFDESIKVFESVRCVGIHGRLDELAFAQAMRGQLLMDMKQFSDAIVQFRAVIKLYNTANAESRTVETEVARLAAHDQLANCLMCGDGEVEAAALLETLLNERDKPFSNNNDIRRWRAKCKASLVLILCSSSKSANSEHALSLARDAVEEFGEEWVTHHALAAALANNGDFSAAIATEEESLPRCPKGFQKLAEERLARYRDHKPLRDRPTQQ